MAALMSHRRGMTLLELLLVLAMLVVFASLSIPSLQAMLQNQRLRRAGDLLRIEMAKARTQAMESGQTQIFRYEVGGNQFSTQALALLSESTEWGQEAVEEQRGKQFSDENNAATGTTQANKLAQLKVALPEGVTFQQGAADIDSRATLLQDDIASNQSLGGASWSQPILFYADGTSSEARIVIKNVREQYMVVRLRRLTGLPVVSDFLTQQELPQIQQMGALAQ